MLAPSPRPALQVLIAGPDVIGRLACRKLLVSRDLVVQDAASRDLTLRWLAEAAPRLLVLDIALSPELDLFVEITGKYPRVAVVLMAPQTRVDFVRARARERLVAHLVRDVWGKPLDAQRMNAVLDDLFGPRRY